MYPNPQGLGTTLAVPLGCRIPSPPLSTHRNGVLRSRVSVLAPARPRETTPQFVHATQMKLGGGKEGRPFRGTASLPLKQQSSPASNALSAHVSYSTKTACSDHCCTIAEKVQNPKLQFLQLLLGGMCKRLAILRNSQHAIQPHHRLLRGEHTTILPTYISALLSIRDPGQSSHHNSNSHNSSSSSTEQ